MKMNRQVKGKPGARESKSGSKVRHSSAKRTSKSNEKHILATYEHAPIGIVECSPDGNYLNVNEEFCRITGYKKEELLTRGIKDVTYEEDYIFDIKLHGRLFAGEIPFYKLEKRYLRKSGGVVWAEVTRSLVSDADGRALYSVGVVLDVSERKRAEDALRTSEERLRLAIEAAQMCAWELDVEKQTYVVGDNFAEVLGFSADLLPKNSTEILQRLTPVEDIQFIQETVAKAIEFRTDLQHLQYRMRNPENGQIIWLEVNGKLIYSPQGNPQRMFGMAQNITARKRAEEKLLASETQYKAVARSIPGGGVYVVDKDLRYLVAEGAVTEAFGLSREMLEGHTVSEVFSGEVKERLEERFQKAFAGETISSETVRNGRVYWSQYAPMDDSLGHAIVVTLDITDRKQIEGVLRQSEERFARFMQYLPGLAWIKDLQGHYVYANAAAEKAFRTPREKLYGKTDEEIFPPEVAAQFNKNDERALMDGKGVQAIETLEYDDGVLHSSLVSKFPIQGLDGNAALIGGIAFDITERLQAEEALHESEERFRAILSQATAGIIRQDAEGRLLFVNQAFCNMLDYTAQELVGKTIWQVTYHEDVEENKRLFDRLMMEGVPFKLEKRLIRRDGSILWVDVSVSPIMNVVGKPQSAVAVEVDITRRKEAEEALQQLNLQLESRVASRTAELQAANRALLENRGRLQLLSQRLVEVQEEERRTLARELHDRVGQSLAALNINLTIISNQLSDRGLLEISTRLADSINLVAEVIALVRDLMSNLRPAVLDDYGLEAALQTYLDQFQSRYGIKVEFEKPNLPILRLGASIEMTLLRIAQEALTNIARHAQADQVILTFQHQQNTILLTIQDNGIGIKSGHEANDPGSHGLRIMRERAEAFDGNLRVSATPGNGTKIEAIIPLPNTGQAEASKEKQL